MAEQHAPENSVVVLGIGLKAYLDVKASAAWSSRAATIASTHPAIVNGKVRLFVLPTLAALPFVRPAFRGTRVEIGAQDLSEYDRGAYTGAVSGADLREIGCEYVEIGHAERRRHFGEDDAEIARKLAAAVRNDLTPVLCIGEPEQVATPEAAAACVARLDLALANVEAPEHTRIIVAYEPEWAIGREYAADPNHVRSVIGALRVRLRAYNLFDAHLLYGGSAQLGTLSDLGRGVVDGLFLGRFAHDTENLAQIIDEAVSLQPLT